MPAFNVLQTNRQFMSLILRIDVDQENDPRVKSVGKYFTSIRVVLNLLFIFSMLASCAVRTYNDSYDFTTRLNAGLVLIVILQEMIVFINIGTNMEKNVGLYRTLQTIVDSEGMDFYKLTKLTM